MKRIGIDVTENEHQDLKIICAKSVPPVSLRELCVRAINKYLGKDIICSKNQKSNSKTE